MHAYPGLFRLNQNILLPLANMNSYSYKIIKTYQDEKD